MRDVTVTSLVSPPTSVNDEWTTASTSPTASTTLQATSPSAAVTTATGVTPIPANLADEPSGLLQQLPAGSTSVASYANLNYANVGGMFNGMLLKDFVNGGFEAWYYRYLLFVYDAPSAPTPPRNTTAPRLQIAARSPSLGSFSTYSWEPYLNVASNGQLYGQYQQWTNNTLTEATGTNGSWPYGTSAANGEGWWCTRTCLLNNATTAAGTPANTRVGGKYVQSQVMRDENVCLFEKCW